MRNTSCLAYVNYRQEQTKIQQRSATIHAMGAHISGGLQKCMRRHLLIPNTKRASARTEVRVFNRKLVRKSASFTTNHTPIICELLSLHPFSAVISIETNSYGGPNSAISSFRQRISN